MLAQGTRSDIEAIRRGAHRGTVRRLLYRTRHLSVDVRLVPMQSPDRVLLSGRVVETRHPGSRRGTGRARVVLMWGPYEIAVVGSDDRGAFACELQPEPDMALSISIGDQPPEMVGLDVLGGAFASNLDLSSTPIGIAEVTRASLAAPRR